MSVVQYNRTQELKLSTEITYQAISLNEGEIYIFVSIKEIKKNENGL